VLVLAPLLPHFGFGTESYLDNHSVRISFYQFSQPTYRHSNSTTLCPYLRLL
jgi:hypothetical protein